MIEQIKQLRVEIDGLAQLCEALKPITKPIGGLYRHEYEEMTVNSEEIKEAVKSLKLSKAWLGKVLEQLGNENPYGSGYKTVEDIVPTADVASRIEDYPVAPDHWPDGEVYKSHIEKVDWLRTEIKRLLGKIEKPTVTIDVSSIKGDFNIEKYLEEMNKYGVMLLEPCVQVQSGGIDKAAQYLQEARFWLGFELGRIRDESK